MNRLLQMCVMERIQSPALTALNLIVLQQERDGPIYRFSSHCNSLGGLSLEIELGSCCLHLEKQTYSDHTALRVRYVRLHEQQ